MKPKTCLSMAICLACTVAAHPSPDGDSAAVATERWSLQRCLDYASERNLNIKISEINAESSDIDVRTAKSAFLPSLSANVSQRIVNNPRSENNTIIDGDRISSSQSKTSYNGSYGIDLQWTLYEGNRRLNDYKQQKVASQIARLNVNESINNIQESIMQAYIQILYAAEAVEINRATLESSRAERLRGEELLAAGTLSKADYAQLAADESNDQYALVSAETTLDDYKLQLKQLLELDGTQEIEIEPLDISDAEVYSILPDKEEVYRAALNSRPEIRAGQLTIEQSELSTAAAKSDYMPTLSLSAGIGTNHTNGNDYTFSEQVKTNWNNSIGLTLSIPIFDRRQTKSNVQKAKLQTNINKLQLMDAQKTLYRSIENFWLNARSAQKQFAAASEKVKSCETSYTLVSEQFHLGMKNTVELLQEKNNLLAARHEMLQAKYTSLLNTTLLDFYCYGVINL